MESAGNGLSVRASDSLWIANLLSSSAAQPASVRLANQLILKRFFTRFPRLPSVVVLILAGPSYFLAYQANPALHFDIGRWDGGFLADVDGFYPPFRMTGPFRHADDSVEIGDFVGRLAKREAGFRIPYHALRTPLKLNLRCHRFGLQGSVALTVNDRNVGDFVFTETSYPWGGIQAVIPQEVAETGPLRIEFLVRGEQTPPSHMPADVGLGFDWIEVTPMSRGVILLPTAAQWLRFSLLMLLGFFFLRFLGTEALAAALGLLTLAALVAAMVVFYPVTTSKILGFAWLSFPFVMLLTWIGELADRRFLSSSPATR
jgi:hypothetical protein